MKQIILPVPLPLNPPLPLALWRPDRADAPTARGREAQACRGCDTWGGCGKCQKEEKQA